ncbi:MAG: SusC/RagA family TonB-linked outer membrane protein [Bacteroidota bacterium]
MIKYLLKKVVLLPFLLMCCFSIFAQQKTVTGTVTDADGKPIPGATIGIKGVSTAKATDSAGNFSMVVPSNQSVLKVSSIGFTYQEMVVGARSAFNVKLLKDTKGLEDVVVIGYGTQRAKNVTGSIVNIDTKKLEDLPVSSLTEMLRGQVPGVNVSGGSTRPGTLATVSIRQQFNFGKDGGGLIPLIVIDDVEQLDPLTGLPTLNTFNLLDLSEVESITVLRDASAAIYGPRGSQGAIIVRTKHGKAGAPKITYSGKFETNNAVSHSKVMNAQQFGIFSNRLNDVINPTNPNAFFTPAEITAMDTINYDWLHDWRAANSMQHSLNVSGGSERATYFAGGSYYTQGANLGSQTFKRWTFRSGTDVTVANGLKLSAVVSANNSNLAQSFTKININDGYAAGGGEQDDYALLLHIPKYIPWQYNINGVNQYVSPVLKAGTLGSATGNNSLSNMNYYALLNNGSQTTNGSFNYNGNFSLQYDIPFVKGLSVKGAYSIGSTSSNTEQDMFAQTLYQATNAAVAGTHLFTANSIWSNPFVNTSNSRISYNTSFNTIQQENFYVNYDRSFGNHNISAVFVGEQAKYSNDTRVQLYNNPVPGGYAGTGATAGTLDVGNSSTGKLVSGTQSYLGRISYNYKSKYLVQFIFRTDASTKVAPQNYWASFPAASFGWVISQEEFFKRNVSWVNNLKIRFSIGKTGNDNIKAWKWRELYNVATNTGNGFGTNGGNLSNGLTPSVSPNPNIDWDATLQRNLGVDIGLLNNRLTINWDGYYNSERNLITSVANSLNVPISVGGTFAEANLANVTAYGTEISAMWSDHIGRVSYNVGMNFALNNNKVTQWIDQPFTNEAGIAGSTHQGYSTIQPAYGYKVWKGTSTGDGILRTDADVAGYWGYLADLANKAGTTPLYNAGGANVSSQAGLKKGMLAYQDLAGTPNATTKTIPGQDGRINDVDDYAKLAKRGFSYGITTNLGVAWQGVSLQAQIATSWGGYNSIDRVNQATSSASATYSQVAYLNDMYDTANNVNGKYPNVGYFSSAYKASDFWSLPTFRMVIRSLSVGYTLPKQWLSSVHISNAKLILSGYNLWDLYNPYPGKYRNLYDGPAVNYPTLRTWSLGVNLGF